MLFIFIWLGTFVLFCILEAVTVALVSIWFAAGALVALVAALCGGQVWLQLVLFFVVSVAVLICTRPLAKRLMARGKTATNADALLDKCAYVTEVINNLKSTGAVRVNGQIWTARSLDGDDVIPAGAEVKIARIEGVKLIVYPTDAVPELAAPMKGR